jgi:signal transduction histidine kinase
MVREMEPLRLLNLAVTDISEHKRIEAELLKAKKLEAMGILAGGIAHDFNNLLGVVLGNINMAEFEIEKLSGVEPESGKRGLTALSNAEKAVFLATNLTKRFIIFFRKRTLLGHNPGPGAGTGLLRSSPQRLQYRMHLFLRG